MKRNLSCPRFHKFVPRSLHATIHMKVIRRYSWIEHSRNRKIVRIWYAHCVGMKTWVCIMQVCFWMVGWCRWCRIRFWSILNIFLTFARLNWSGSTAWGLADHSLECRSEMVSSNCLEAACAALQVGDGERWFLQSLAIGMQCAHICLLNNMIMSN